MKKILISVLILLLLILTYIVFAKGINIGFININNVKDLKTAKNDLNSSFDMANELVNVKYNEHIDNLESSIQKLKVSKQKYQTKTAYTEDNNALTTVQIKTYTIHYLWTIIGNYKQDSNLKSLTLDLQSTETQDVYDMNFTVLGNYIGITDFLYDLENDEELNFEIENLKINSGVTSTVTSALKNNKSNNENNNEKEVKKETTNTATNSSDSPDANGTIIQATFTIKNVGIILE